MTCLLRPVFKAKIQFSKQLKGKLINDQSDSYGFQRRDYQ